MVFRSKHHCRLCGKAACADCCCFVALDIEASDQQRDNQQSVGSPTVPLGVQYRPAGRSLGGLRCCRDCGRDVAAGREKMRRTAKGGQTAEDTLQAVRRYERVAQGMREVDAALTTLGEQIMALSISKDGGGAAQSAGGAAALAAAVRQRTTVDVHLCLSLSALHGRRPSSRTTSAKYCFHG